MSKPKYWWYGWVRLAITKNKKEHSFQSYIMAKAIQDATRETLELPNGDERMVAVEEILVKQRLTAEGVAQKLHYDEHTVRLWVNKYVNLVGKKAGY